jgi:ABC-type dipeptide/oligopeptide/nickel transport system ATPase component
LDGINLQIAKGDIFALAGESGCGKSVTMKAVLRIVEPPGRIVNGEIRESVQVPPEQGHGSWSFKVDKSCWLALLVRGHYADKPEIIAAHSSPVMIDVAGSPMLAAADAVTGLPVERKAAR